MNNQNQLPAAGARKKISTRNIAVVAVLSALAFGVMMLEFPLGFAPPFYKLDFSEVIVMLGAFALGPWVGMLIEAIKILLNLLFTGSITGGVGELGNFLIGCSLIMPAAFIYRRMHTRKGAIIAMAVGTVSLVVVGCFLNYYLLLPTYARVFMPMDSLIAMGTAINPAITNRFTFVLFAVAPFNLLKGVAVSLITGLLYKRVSPLLHKKR